MNLKQITKSFTQYKASIIPEIKKLYTNRNSRIAISAAACLIVFSLVFFTATRSEVYSLTIDGKTIGYLTDKSMVENAISDITADYTSSKSSINVSIDENAIAVKSTDLKKSSVTALTAKEIKNAIKNSEICTADGWAINVNGKNIVAVTSEKTAKGILNDVKKHYLTTGSKVISADFKENVSVTKAAVGLSEFAKPEEAVTMILTGEKAPQIYTVKDGDTLWDIAVASGMSTTELQNANPGFDPNKLKIGQQLNLVAVKPYITVITKEQITAVAAIPFQTTYEDTNTLYKGQTKVKTAGVNGSQQVTSEVSKENGIVTATNVINTVVVSQPQTQVALKGTKPGATYLASRGGGRSISVDASGSEIVAYAKEFIGTPYVHGGSSPSGFDCSGFTSYVYAHFGGSLPRTASGQYNSGTFVEKSDLEPGDLVFFGSSRISHVGIYVGGGKFIHSPQEGEEVEIRSFSSCTLHYAGAVRAE